MPICPNCKTRGERALTPCPTDDGFYLVEDDEFAGHGGDRFLGREVADRYVVHSVLGRGSMARVYRALQKGVERDVALKVFESDTILERSLGRSSTARERENAQLRFVQEAKVLGKISHPSCVTVYDFGVGDDGTFLYMAMEYVAGVSLREAINRKLKFGAILQICQQVLFALREAHSLGIVHRDLKPENIILSYRFSSGEHVVKVLDFGIAKLLQGESESRTRVGALFGTPAYMSPEQCRGEVDTIGPAVDIYALGCMVFEMVSGRLPFVAQVPQQMVRLHQEAPVPDLKPRAGLEVPGQLEAFIKRCLAKKAEDRFESASEALAELTAIAGVHAVDDPDGLSTGNLGQVAEAIRDRTRRAYRRRLSVSVPDDHIVGDELDPVGKYAETPPSGTFARDLSLESNLGQDSFDASSSELAESGADGSRDAWPAEGERDDTSGVRRSRVVGMVLSLLIAVLSATAAFYFLVVAGR